MIRWIVRHPLLASAAPLAAFLASAGLLLALQSARRPPALVAGTGVPYAEGPDDFGEVGEFAFTERSGHTVTQDTLRGKVWIVGCFFTCCTESCPKLSASMARLQAELAGEPDVRLVSVTVDPTHDTPETLGRYATAYNADADRWLFLTGSEEGVRRFVRERLKLAAEKNTAADATPGSRVLHDPRLTLVDRRGHIAGYFDGTDPAAVGRLKAAAERLAREAP
ncbi:MAG TPA: SCO family protein [Gemmataceae bacterium]|jgi:protein SCO1/2